MKEQGIITRIISGKLVEVAFQRSEACAKCRACHDLGQGMVGIEAVNEVGAKREDVVEIEIPSGELVRGSITIFLIPVFFLGFGYLLGALMMRSLGWLAWEEAAGVVFAFAALVLSFYAVRWYDRKVEEKRALRARIVRVVAKKQ